MKEVCLVLFFLPFMMYSKGDSLLYTKRFNLNVGFDLTIPQVRYVEGVITKGGPNGPVASLTDPLFDTYFNQNGFNFYVNAEIKLYKKLYIQSGFCLEVLRNKSFLFRDTLSYGNGVLVNAEVWQDITYNFRIPLGIQYRVKNYFFTTLGLSGYIFNISSVSDKLYHNSSLVFSDYSFGTPHEPISFSYYFAGNLRVLPRTFINLGVSNAFPDKYTAFKDNLYYTIGVRFYVL